MLAINMTAVAAHPAIRRGPDMVSRPMMRAFPAMSMMIAMTGVATILLTTALQYSAFTAFIDVKLRATPSRGRNCDGCVEGLSLNEASVKAFAPAEDL
jgi:hypothetical protein